MIIRRDMKIFRVLIPLILIAGWMMTSCDKLSAPYATVKNEFDSTNKPYVLLEEFTGHKCINCPLASQKARKLVDYYKGRLILMEVHGTYLADPDAKYTLDLRTPEGNQWITDFAIPYVPMGLIDRATFGSAFPVSGDQWAAAVETQMNKPMVAKIRASATYNDDNHQFSATVTTWFKQKLTAGANICLYIVEDSIVGIQANKDTAAGPTPDINPYYFNETFIGSMNGNYGEQLTSSVDTTRTYSFSKTAIISGVVRDSTQLSLITAILDPSATPRGQVIGVNKVKIIITAKKSRMQGLKH
jgi:hypothetical protein